MAAVKVPFLAMDIDKSHISKSKIGLGRKHRAAGPIFLKKYLTNLYKLHKMKNTGDALGANLHKRNRNSEKCHL